MICVRCDEVLKPNEAHGDIAGTAYLSGTQSKAHVCITLLKDAVVCVDCMRYIMIEVSNILGQKD